MDGLLQKASTPPPNTTDASTAVSNEAPPSLLGFFKTAGGRYTLFIAVLSITMITTLSDMVRIWASSSAYLHGAFAAPTAYWLIRAGRSDWFSAASSEANASRQTTAYGGLLALAAALCLWLIGRAAGIALVQQFAFVGALIAGFWIFFGAARLKRYAAPLAFLLFMPPLGDGLLWPMQITTARVAEGLLALTGFNAARDGVLLTLGPHAFAITEACAGLRLLTAMMMAGFFIAYIAVASPSRRLALAALAVILGFATNWLRVYGVIAFTALTDDRFGVAEDHFAVGVVAFIVALIALLVTARRFAAAERRASKAAVNTANETSKTAPAPQHGFNLRDALAFAVIVIAGVYATLVLTPPSPVLQAPPTLAIAPPALWREYSDQHLRPFMRGTLFEHADKEQTYFYTDGKRRIDVVAGLFAFDRPRAEAAGYDSHAALADRLGLSAGICSPMTLTLNDGRPVDAWSAPATDGGLAAARVFLHDGRVKTSETGYAWSLARARLRGRHAPAAVIYIAASGKDRADARTALQDFLKAGYALKPAADAANK